MAASLVVVVAPQEQRDEQRAGQVRLTSIGQVCEFELNALKLCGGFVFEQNLNRYLSFGYKIGLIALTRYFVSNSLDVYDRISSDSKTSQQNLKLFWTFHRVASLSCLIASTVSALRHRNLISILLRKRLDARYFEGPPWAASTGPVQPATKGDKRASRPEVNALSHLGLRLSPLARSQARLKWELRASAATIVRVPRLRLARYLILAYLAICGLTATLRGEYERAYNERRPALVERNNTTLLLDRSSDVVAAAGSVWPARGQPPATPFGPPDLRLGSVASWLAGQLLGLGMEAVRLSPRLLLKLLHALLELSQWMGQPMIALYITAILSDLLRRAAEQELAAARSSSRAAPADGAALQLGDGSGPPAQAATPLIKTTDLLIQTRDVLIALRSAMSLNYLFIQVLDMSRLMAVFSLFTALIAADQYDWLGLLLADYLRLILGILLARIGYHWLHSEARQLCFISEQRLIEGAIAAQSPNESPAPPAKQPAAAADSANSSGAPRQPANEQSRRTQEARQLHNQVARLEAGTNFRLAREIEHLWPTDWFTPDLQSYVSQNFFVITVVATLQQLVEASAKVELQAQRANNASSSPGNRGANASTNAA